MIGHDVQLIPFTVEAEHGQGEFLPTGPIPSWCAGSGPGLSSENRLDRGFSSSLRAVNTERVAGLLGLIRRSLGSVEDEVGADLGRLPPADQERGQRPRGAPAFTAWASSAPTRPCPPPCKHRRWRPSRVDAVPRRCGKLRGRPGELLTAAVTSSIPQGRRRSEPDPADRQLSEQHLHGKRLRPAQRL